MIKPILIISWLNLKRDRLALALTFVLPIVFFSIFAMIFGGMGGSSAGADTDGKSGGGMEIVVVDEDGSEVSERFVQAIDDQDALAVVSSYVDEEGAEQAYSRKEAHRSVRKGNFSAAVIIPPEFGASFGSFAEEQVEVEVIYDAANPMALPTVSGLLQAAGFMAAPDILVEKGLGQMEQAGGPLTPEQKKIMAAIKPVLRGEKAWDDISLEDENKQRDKGEGGEAESIASGFQGLVRVKETNARAGDKEEAKRSLSMIPYYAAGTAVMFLLFSMAGAGGALLEEEENGVLERLLTSHAPMTTLLMGKWLFFMGLGIAQVTVMFLWGAWLFDLDLFTVNHLAGFTVMTVMTAGAAAGFGILLATACRSRSQLGGVSTIVILIMSALGGSMVPKFVAPFLEKTAPYTMNGWALDGYLKVFWYDEPGEGVVEMLMGLLPQLAMLVGMGMVFLMAARGLARRWEIV